MSPTRRFRVAWTGDFRHPDGSPRFGDVGLGAFAGHDHIEVVHFAEHRPEVGADQLPGVQGAVVLTPAVTARSLSDSRDLLAVGRFGVGFDSVDVGACTRADVVAFITAGAVDRSVAEATLTWMLALAHQVGIKDALVRQGRWDERTRYMGRELRGRTLGVIGLGGIGRALVRLLEGFGMKQPLAYDPFLDPEAVRKLGLRPVGLDELLSTADFVSIHCPLNERTRNLLGPRELGLMRPDAYLINTARGGIVDEDALYGALAERRIAGAALDCFVGEPVTRPHRFGEFDHVLLAPHSIAWTEEMFRDIGLAVCRGMLDLSLGRRPNGVLNPQVFERASFRDKWARLCPAVHPPASP